MKEMIKKNKERKRNDVGKMENMGNAASTLWGMKKADSGHCH